MTINIMRVTIYYAALLMLVPLCVAQLMSLSLVNSSFQLFCYDVNTMISSASPIQCATTDERFIAPRSFHLQTASAPWSHRHDTVVRVYPRPLTFTRTDGALQTFASGSLVLLTSRTNSNNYGHGVANDIFASNDRGRTWELIAGMTVEGRRAFGPYANTSFPPLEAPTVLFNQSSGQLWVIGGLLNGEYQNSVWTSNDTRQWTQVTVTNTSMFIPRAFAAGNIDSNGRMYIIAGDSKAGYLHDVWVSENATTWMLLCSAAPFPARHDAQLLIVRSTALQRDVLVLIGRSFTIDLWISSDGALSWAAVTSLNGLALREGSLLDVSRSNVLVFIGGAERRQLFISLDDAISWRECSSIIPISNRGWMKGTFDEDDHYVVVAGINGQDEFHDVWRSGFFIQ